MSEEYGLISTGFNKKRLDILFDEIEQDYKSIYGDNFKTSPETKQGQVISIMAAQLASLWDLGEACYAAFNPDSAVNLSLDHVVEYNNIVRMSATPSTGVVTITGTNGTVIPLGSQIRAVDNDTVFSTTEEVTIVGGASDVPVSADATGPIQALAGTLTDIVTPITGWSSVTNASDVTVGNDRESDEELRIRRRLSPAIESRGVQSGTRAQLLALDGVISATVFDNDTNGIVDSVPANSAEAIVYGGDDNSIAEVLLINKNLGIPWAGSTTITVEDDEGIEVDISFTRPTVVAIEVEVAIFPGADFAASSSDEIKENIVLYAQGNLIAGRGFNTSDDVIYNELFSPINLVTGHTISTLTINKVGDTPGTINLPIAIREVADFDISNITVTLL